VPENNGKKTFIYHGRYDVLNFLIVVIEHYSVNTDAFVVYGHHNSDHTEKVGE